MGHVYRVHRINTLAIQTPFYLLEVAVVGAGGKTISAGRNGLSLVTMETCRQTEASGRLHPAAYTGANLPCEVRGWGGVCMNWLLLADTARALRPTRESTQKAKHGE